MEHLTSIRAWGIGALFLAHCSLSAVAQNAPLPSDSNWNARSEQLFQWAASVKTVRCNFFLSQFGNSQSRIAQKATWKNYVRQNPNAVPFPDDANTGYSCFWVADTFRWRCDQYRFYPTTGLDLTKCLFDGERYWIFDQYYGRAKISAQDQSFCVAKDLRSNYWLQLGVKNLITPVSPNAAGDFKFIETSTFAGRKCSIYRAQNLKDTVTVYADQQTPLLLKWKEVYQVTPDHANVFVKTWNDIRTVNGVLLPFEVVAFFEVLPTRRDTDLSCLMKLNWLQSYSNSGVLDTTSRCLYEWATPRRRPLPPFECKSESYDIEKGLTIWGGTRVFQIQTCEVNQSLGEGFFQNVIPVGTPLEDQIEDPGRISYMGGNSSAESARIQLGTPPPLEEPNVKAMGALPAATQP